MLKTALLISALLAVALSKAIPEEASVSDVGLPASSVWSGHLNVVPFSTQGGRDYCQACAPISVFSVLYWYNNNVYLNTTQAGFGSCTVQRESYIFNSVKDVPGYPGVYHASLLFRNAYKPVCFYFLASGAFSLTLDTTSSLGACPPSSIPAASCTASGAGVTQIIQGTFGQQYLPQPRLYSGSISIVPYSYAGAGYACLNCNPVTSSATMNWSMFGFSLTIQAGGSAGCSVNAQSVIFTDVVPYGRDYPNYYISVAHIEGIPIPVCFYWDAAGTKHFFIQVDGQGTCPNVNQHPSCAAGWVSGTVTQVWTGLAA